MSLPPVDPAVTAEAVAALPARLRKRLDEAVTQARGWPVETAGDRVTVRPDDQVYVVLTVPVTDPADAVCSCLLAPRCLHRTAVLSAAPIRAGGDDPPAPTDDPASDSDPARTGTAPPDQPQPGGPEVSAAQADAAQGLWVVAATILANGIAGAGAVAQADLLRAVHQARATGLHGPAAAAIRVVEHLRAGRRAEPAFRLADLADDLRELLAACHRLAAGDGTVAGVARRDYEPVGDLRLYGLFCEPIRAATGHAGAVTYLADPTGRLWVVSDVKPSDRAATGSATRASVDLGEVRLSHHALSRAGLRAINAHASTVGRLSHGRARQAVAAPGAGWFDPPLDALWQPSLAEQVDRWLAGTVLPAHARPAAHDLAFLDGTVLGTDRRGLLLTLDRPDAAPPLTVVVSAPHEDPALPYVTNLRVLGIHATGRRIRLVGRFTGPRQVDGLAFSARWLQAGATGDTAHGGNTGHGGHGGHVDLGATPLTRADVAETVRARGNFLSPGATFHTVAGRPVLDPTPSPAPAAPPLHLLRHQVERVASAGRSALLSGVDADARRLADAHLGTASAVLTGLAAAGVRRTRDVFGRLDPHDADRLARAWLTAAVYEQAATRATTRQAWSAPAPEAPPP
ncbi:hypothetical protein [Actinoplanes awajinensis]|uniref:SWIM-type domain-containing protein n=1 Tax=Actinoplanes awajinensis subsp. mycoplanecinus TaxID=135947 RepID=A0A101JJ57_9ACTN|nr:hypothetical protein [Actinoplanes awajinensis]KUL27848.1 hypothetical protein ADL15_33990 [Actinoplanes awajinensis subsp. mycoplanecinus]